MASILPWVPMSFRPGVALASVLMLLLVVRRRNLVTLGRGLATVPLVAWASICSVVPYAEYRITLICRRAKLQPLGPLVALSGPMVRQVSACTAGQAKLGEGRKAQLTPGRKPKRSIIKRLVFVVLLPLGISRLGWEGQSWSSPQPSSALRDAFEAWTDWECRAGTWDDGRDCRVTEELGSASAAAATSDLVPLGSSTSVGSSSLTARDVVVAFGVACVLIDVTAVGPDVSFNPAAVVMQWDSGDTLPLPPASGPTRGIVTASVVAPGSTAVFEQCFPVLSPTGTMIVPIGGETAAFGPISAG